MTGARCDRDRDVKALWTYRLSRDPASGRWTYFLRVLEPIDEAGTRVTVFSGYLFAWRWRARSAAKATIRVVSRCNGWRPIEIKEVFT